VQCRVLEDPVDRGARRWRALGYRRGGGELRYRDYGGRQRVERFPAPEERRQPPYGAGSQGGGRAGAAPGQLPRAGGTRGHLRRLLPAVAGVPADLGLSGVHRRDPGPAARAAAVGRPAAEQHPALRRRRLVADLSRRMGPHSVRHCYTLFRGPLRRAVKDRLIDDPCIDVPLPKEPDLRKTFDDRDGRGKDHVRRGRARPRQRDRSAARTSTWLAASLTGVPDRHRPRRARRRRVLRRLVPRTGARRPRLARSIPRRAARRPVAGPRRGRLPPRRGPAPWLCGERVLEPAGEPLSDVLPQP
jgi:hypothetical protein